MLAVHVPRCLAEEREHDQSIGIELPIHHLAVHRRHGGEDDKLVILAQVADEIIKTGTLRDFPPAGSGPFAVNQQVFQAEDEGVWWLELRIDFWEELWESWLGVITQ